MATCKLCLLEYPNKEIAESHVMSKCLLQEGMYFVNNTVCGRGKVTEKMLCKRECEERRLNNANESLFYEIFWKSYLKKPNQKFSYDRWFFGTIVSLAFRHLESRGTNPDNLYLNLKEELRQFSLYHFESAPIKSNIKVVVIRNVSRAADIKSASAHMFVNDILKEDSCGGPGPKNKIGFECAVISLKGLHFVITLDKMISRMNLLYDMFGSEEINMARGHLDMTEPKNSSDHALIIRYAQDVSEDIYRILAGMPDKCKNILKYDPKFFEKLAGHANPKHEVDPRFPINWMQLGFTFDIKFNEFKSEDFYTIGKSEIKAVGPLTVKLTKATQNDGKLSHVLCCINVKPIFLVQYLYNRFEANRNFSIYQIAGKESLFTDYLNGPLLNAAKAFLDEE